MSLLDTASLLLTPNAYKEGKLYSVIPSDGSGDFTFTRATTATRVNSNGLVELVPYNLLQRSEEFDNAAWSKINTSVTANAETAPNGTLTADLFNSNGTSNQHRVEQSLAFVPTTKTYSVYAKANDASFIQISSAGSTAGWVNFDLSNGTLSNQGAAYIGSISNVGNGWYLCSVYTADSGATSLRISIVTNLSSARIETNSISGGVYLWGAQVNEGSLLPYQKTETRLNIPRLDYSNGTCPSILLEPQRTNLLLQSSSFDNAYWVKTNATIIANNTTAPDGTLTADTIIPNTTNGYHNARAFNLTTIINPYTYTIYAKANGYNFIGIQLSSNTNFTNYFEGVFNLSNGTIESTGRAVGFTGTRSITAIGNGWYRCSISITNATSSSTALVSVNPQSTNDPTTGYTGNGTSGIYFWGAQLEAGSYATSYIPTTTASVTRNAEVLSKTGISSLIGQTEGTVYTELYWEGPREASADIIALMSNTTNYFRFFIRPSNGSFPNAIEIVRVKTGETLASVRGSSLASAQTLKIAVVYSLTANTLKMYVNGSVYIDTTLSYLPSMSWIKLGSSHIDTNQFGNGIKSTALWQFAATDAELAQLTTI